MPDGGTCFVHPAIDSWVRVRCAQQTLFGAWRRPAGDVSVAWKAVVAGIAVVAGERPQAVDVVRMDAAAGLERVEKATELLLEGGDVLGVPGLLDMGDEHPQHAQYRGRHVGLRGGALTQLVEAVGDVLGVVEVPWADEHPTLIILEGRRSLIGSEHHAQQPPRHEG